MEKIQSITIVVHVRGRNAIHQIKEVITRASVDTEDAALGVQSFHVKEIPDSECEVCGGKCIGADA